MTEDIIKAEGLTKVFNKILTAVDHADFSVKSGEVFGALKSKYHEKQQQSTF